MKRHYKNILYTACFILAISGFTFSANAQIGTNNLFCPFVPYSEGMLNLQITALGDNPATFSAAMIGAFQNIGGNVSGGLDWMTTRNGASSATVAPTNEIGSQLVTWWSRANNRNTKIQITNTSDNSGPHTAEGLKIHVHIYSSDCAEIRDFCDVYRPLDTHVYDLANLVTNTGSDIAESNLADNEGILVITPVTECSGGTIDPGELPIDHNFLSGNVYISDTLGYTYGTNMYARQSICNAPGCTGILNGSTNARLDTVLPGNIYGLFNSVSPSAGSDVVVMSFYDDYGPPYLPRISSSSYFASIFDNNEIAQSCGEVEACFLRLGIDSAMPARQDFTVP